MFLIERKSADVQYLISNFIIISNVLYKWCSQMFFKIGVLKNFTIFTRKHLYWNLFLIQLQLSSPATILTPAQVFSCEQIFNNVYFEKHLGTAAFEILWKCSLIMKYYHSKLCSENVFHVHFIKWLHQHICH